MDYIVQETADKILLETEDGILVEIQEVVASVSDNIAISDLEQISRERVVSVNDSISLSDNIEIPIVRVIGVNDSISLAESIVIARIKESNFPIIIEEDGGGFKPTMESDITTPKVDGDTQLFKPRINYD